MPITYGVAVRLSFDPIKHAKFEHLKKRVQTGEYRIINGFEPLVKEGDVIFFNQVISTKKYYPQKPGDDSVKFKLFTNTDPDGFLIGNTTNMVGHIKCIIPKEYRNLSKYENGIKVELMFGKSEISMKAIHVKSNIVCECQLQYT
jgi:hypothetical protein